MSRADLYLARASGNTSWYLPADVVLVRNKKHPLFDERANDPPDREMIESIKLFGVLQPPLVCKQVDDNGKPYMGCICGRQRFINALVAEAELKAEGKLIPGKRPGHIECIVRNDFTPEELREVIIHENAKRREESFKNKISKAARLLAAYEEQAEADGEKWSEAMALRRVAGHFGVPASTIKRWLEVPKLAAPARKAVIAGEVPLGLVDDLRSMSPDNQEKAVHKAAASPAVGTRGARAATSDVPKAPPEEKQKRRPRKAIEAEIDKLRTALADPLLDDKVRMYKEGALYGMRFAIADDDDSSKAPEEHGPTPTPVKTAKKGTPPRPEQLAESASEERAMLLEEARALCDRLNAGDGDLLRRLSTAEFVRFAKLATELLPDSAQLKATAGAILRGVVKVDDVHVLVDQLTKVRK